MGDTAGVPGAGGVAGAGGSPGADGGGDGATRTMVYVGCKFWGAPAAVKPELRAFELDINTGSFTMVGDPISTAEFPSFLTHSPDNKVLYVNLELKDAIAAFSINAATGKIGTKINEVAAATGHSGAAHLSIDATGKWLFQSYYGSGSFAAYGVADNGAVGALVKGFNKGSLVGPNVHSAVAAPSSKFVFVATAPNAQEEMKGAKGRLAQLMFDAASGALVPNDPPTVDTGGQARHIAIDPQGQYLYVNNERANSVASFKLADEGKLAMIGAPENVLAPTTANSAAADLRIHPGGKYLYNVNRGDSTITILTVDPNGRAKTASHQKIDGGRDLRNIAINSKGTVLIVPAMGSNMLYAYRIDPQTGLLTKLGAGIMVPAPTGVDIVELK